MSDKELFNKNLVFLDYEVADRNDFFIKFSKLMLDKGYVADSFYEAITTREERYPTGLQTTTIGVAIPHTDPENLKKPFIAVIRPKKEIEFEPMGMTEGQVNAKLIFVLGVLRDGGQVVVLQKLMNMFMNETAVNKLLNANGKENVIEIIDKFFENEEI